MPMTPARLSECLTILTAGAQRTGLADEEGPVLRSAARLVGMSARTIQHWLRGEAPVPEDVAAWLERRVAAREANPPPVLTGGRSERVSAEEKAARCERLRSGLQALDWSAPFFGQQIGRPRNTIFYWTSGHSPPPLEAIGWVERLAADDAADLSPRVKASDGLATEVTAGIDLLRKAGLTKAAKLLERQGGEAVEAEEAAPAPAPAEISGPSEKRAEEPAAAPDAPMTADEAWGCLGVLGWKARDPARLIGFDTRNGRRWFSGDDTMPPPLAAWLRKLVAVHRAATEGLPKNTPEEGRVAVGAKAVAAAMGDLQRLANEVRDWERAKIEERLAAKGARPVAAPPPPRPVAAPKAPLPKLDPDTESLVVSLGADWIDVRELPVAIARIEEARLGGLLERGSRPDASRDSGFATLFRLSELGLRVKEALTRVRTVPTVFDKVPAPRQPKLRLPNLAPEVETIVVSLGPEWVERRSLPVAKDRLEAARKQGLLERGSRADPEAPAVFFDRYRLSELGLRVKETLLKVKTVPTVFEEEAARRAERAASWGAAAERQPSEIPGVPASLLSRAMRDLLEWIGADENGPDEQEHADAMQALRETFERGTTFRRWVRHATRRLEELGYTLEDDDNDEGADVEMAALTGLLGEDHPSVRGGR
jgi:hypothetical protein